MEVDSQIPTSDSSRKEEEYCVSIHSSSDSTVVNVSVHLHSLSGSTYLIMAHPNPNTDLRSELHHN